VCSVKHQEQLSGGQGPRSEKQFEWTRTAPVAPKSQLPSQIQDLKEGEGAHY